MKKLLTVSMLTMLLFVFGCGNGNVEEVETSSQAKTNPITATHGDKQEKSTTDFPQPFFDTSVDSLMAELNKSEILGEFYKVSFSDFDCYTAFNEYNTINVAIYCESNSKYPFAIKALTKKERTNNELLQKSKNIIGALEKKLSATVKQYDKLNFSGYYVACKNPPISINKLEDWVNPKSKFFSEDNNIRVYKDLSSRGKYVELYQFISDFISSNSTDENDPVYQVLDVLNPILPLMDGLHVSYDEFSGYATIYPANVANISDTINFVPSMRTNGPEINILAGFQSPQWFFFEYITLKIEDEQVQTSLSEQSRDVLSGSLVSETANISMFDDYYDKLSNASTAVLRFSNENGENLDHVLTDEELSGFKAIFALSSVPNALSNIEYNAR